MRPAPASPPTCRGLRTLYARGVAALRNGRMVRHVHPTPFMEVPMKRFAPLALIVLALALVPVALGDDSPPPPPPAAPASTTANAHAGAHLRLQIIRLQLRLVALRYR